MRPGPKIIKLKLETRLKSQTSNWLKWRPVAISAAQTSDWIKWRPVAISANQMLDI
jgi:hypothetical protein